MIYQVRVRLVRPKGVEFTTLGPLIEILDVLVDVSWTFTDADIRLKRLQSNIQSMRPIYPYGCTKPVDLHGMAPGAVVHPYIKASD
jgi:hypothetical protein